MQKTSALVQRDGAANRGARRDSHIAPTGSGVSVRFSVKLRRLQWLA
jgi:hypothetical protein